MNPLPLLILLVLTAGLLFWPRRGLLWRWRAGEQARTRIQIEDALKYIYLCEMEGRRPSLPGIAGRLQIPENQAATLVQSMQDQDLVSLDGLELRLTDDARAYALHVVRAHRLWERHLADETGYAEHQWHARAEQAEHELTPAAAEELAAQLNHPLTDPHGDPIPTLTGEVAARPGQPLTTLPAGQTARILHLEDEPEALYAQLVADGFYPGMRLRVLDQAETKLRVWGDGNEHTLAPIAAATITVEPVTNGVPAAPGPTLADLSPYERGRISELSPRCRGAERRRFLDLGFVPGTEVMAELVSPGGDPTAYRVRDTLIALRAEQACFIHIEPLITSDGPEFRLEEVAA